MIRVTHDHDEQKEILVVIREMPLYGMERVMGLDDTIPNGDLPMVPFKLYDDDENLLYTGELSDDDECLNQSAALRWGETMAGATLILVKRHGRFVQEIA